jgi:uncharacterized protein YecE (DUF72 family)
MVRPRRRAAGRRARPAAARATRLRVPPPDLLRRHGVALAIAHHPERPFQAFELTADFTFLRFHHGARGRRGNYSDRELGEWADRVASLAQQAEVFAYFNNDWEGFAVRNALALRGRVEEYAGDTTGRAER